MRNDPDVAELETHVARQRANNAEREAEARRNGGIYDPVLRRWVDWTKRK